MNFSEKKIIYKLSVLIFHFLFCDSIYASEDEGFFGNFFGSSPKTPQKSSQIPSQNISSPVTLTSYNSQSFDPQLPHSQPLQPQVVMTEQMNLISQQVGTFLQAFPKILKETAELERHIPTLIPEDRLNPKNLCNIPKSGDWRVYVLAGNCQKFLLGLEGKEDLDCVSLGRINTFSKDIETLKQKRTTEKGIDIKKKTQDLDVQSLGTHDWDILEKMTQEEHLRALVQLPGMLRIWFFNTCSPSRQSLSNFLQDYGYFSQWWTDLTSELMDSPHILLLYSLLQQRSNPTTILNLLDELLVQSLLLKSRSLYEQLLPTFMDLKTSSSTLKNLKDEASREDSILKNVLHNRNLYKKIESRIAETIRSTVTPLLEDCLKQMADDSLGKSIQEAFLQGLIGALDNKKDSLPEKELEKSQDPVTVEVKPNEILKERLQEIIVNTIKEAISGGLNQAAGRVKDEPKSNSSWRKASKTEDIVNKPSFFDEQSLTVDIAPIMQVLCEFIKPPEESTSRSWLFSWSSSAKTSIPPNLIQVPIPLEIQQKWKIPSYESIKRSKKSSRKYDIINDITPIRAGLLKEIRGLREYRYSITHKQPQGLLEFLIQKNSVQLLFDFPRAYAHTPGIGGAELLPKILAYFEQYEALIISYRRNLQKAGKSDLSVYLDPRRLSLDLCRSHKRPFFHLFPSLNSRDLNTGWICIEEILLLEPKVPNSSDKDSFHLELAENVFLLSMVDGFPDESLNRDTLDIERLIGNAKKALSFKKKCEAKMADEPLPLEKDAQILSDRLFQERCSEIEGVNGAIERMLIRQKSKKRNEDQQFQEDRNLLILFFTEFFRETLTKHLFDFGLTFEKLETLKKLASPLQRPLGSNNASPIPSVLLRSQRDDQVMLHVPVSFSDDSQLSLEGSPPLNDHTQPQGVSNPDSDLPPLVEFKMSGNDGKK